MRRAPLVIFFAWLVVCVGYEGWQMAAFMAVPATDDLHAHAWGIQLVQFTLFRLGFWVAALLFALGIEGFWHRRPQPAA